MDYDPAVKKNEIPFFATKWMQLETIILNEINQSKKKKKKPEIMFSLNYSYKYRGPNVTYWTERTF